MSTGLIHLYMGSGKGKTTAAVGLAARAAGYGRRVLFAQFLKGSPSGEVSSLEALGVCVLRSEISKGFFKFMAAEEQETFRAEQKRLFNEVRRLVSEDVPQPAGLLVMDEALDALALGLLDDGELQDFISRKPDALELVFTGREAPSWLEERADYITDMRKVKHPYDRGIGAREAVEY